MKVALCLALLAAPVATYAQQKERARDLRIPLDGTPGPLDAITDVPGVEVGHATLVSGSGKLVVGKGPVRTGVTAVLPRGKRSGDPVFAGWFTLNGNGEMTGTTWLEEAGFLWGPVMITNTHSVGVVRDAVIEWLVKQARSLSEYDWSLRVAGVPVGREIPDLLPCREPCGSPRSARDARLAADVGSIIIVVATDAPLLPHQLKRVAKRAALGVGKMGGVGGNSSGDIFIAFSTANPRAAVDTGLARLTMLPNERITPLFEATVQATEEAIINALLAAETMTGADDLKVTALPHDRLREVLRKYNRLNP